MHKVSLISVVLLVGTTHPGAADEKVPRAPIEFSIADLPVDEYRAEPYLRGAQSLQQLGKEKACEQLRKLAAQEMWPYTRTLVLCRMLFKAKPKASFRKARIGDSNFPGGTSYEDWPLEPIELVDGVPFLVAWGHGLGGLPEPPVLYLRYCVEQCDWNTTEFKAKSKEEMQKALEKLLTSPKWKGNLDKDDKMRFKSQIK